VKAVGVSLDEKAVKGDFKAQKFFLERRQPEVWAQRKVCPKCGEVF
jgi:hypothetical protein